MYSPENDVRAYLIDTPNKQVVEVEWDGDYSSIREHIRAELYTAVFMEHRDTLFVDDEGLINGNPYGWFVIDGYHQPLRGYGLVLGTDDVGESVEPRTSLDALRAKIKFPDDAELDAPESYAHIEVIGTDDAEEFLRMLGLS